MRACVSEFVRACACVCMCARVRVLTLIEAQALSNGDKLVIDRCNVDAKQRSHWLAIASANRSKQKLNARNQN